MRIIHCPPVCVGRGQWGIWRVTANSSHSCDYYAFTMAEACRRYLMEFGPVYGDLNVKFIKKPLDKPYKVCYNTDTK